MKWFRVMAMVLVGIMLFAIFCTALAVVKSDTFDPLYHYTRRVSAALSISSGGQATCYGYVKANDAQSNISITITLYRKSGASWNRVDSWSTSGSALVVEIEKKRQVSEGTYKVVLTGSVTNSEGKKELPV